MTALENSHSLKIDQHYVIFYTKDYDQDFDIYRFYFLQEKFLKFYARHLQYK